MFRDAGSSAQTRAQYRASCELTLSARGEQNMNQTLARSVAACVLTFALVTLAGAQAAPQSKTTNQFLTSPVAPSTATPNEKLKSDVAKMVAETKAGRKSAPSNS